ncbi:MAG: methionine synthase [Lawsonibacter sp.]|nr:methionine synthase [Lawsonibacter sp.]
MIAVTQLNTDEILRYMGCPSEKADEALRGQVEACIRELLSVIRPRWSWRESALAFEAGGVRLESGLLLPGEDLSAHLTGCNRAAVFCATLGAEADALVRRAERLDMAKALTLDCCASAAIEAVCDQIEAELQEKFPGCFFPFRYSPGYGDLPLGVQSPLLELLDAPRRVGLCATDSDLLTPRKSVTAILGVAQGALEQKKRSCLGCPAQGSCQYRKAGGHCGIS